MSTSKLCEVQVTKAKTNDFHQKCLQVKSLESNKVEISGKKVAKSATDGKETVKYVTNDGMTIMIVPSKDTNYYPIKMKENELNRLKGKAVIVTEKEKLRMTEEAKAEQSRLEHESAVRKNELKQFDKKGKAGGAGRLSGLEREARDKANYLLKRAWELRHEDEDEVKKANSLILQAKCQAIRDAQLAEHKLIQRELKEEEKRVEQMMGDERARQLMEEKKKMEEERARKARYVMELNEQMEEIEARRLLNAELQLEERRKTNEAMFAVMLEELESIRKKEEEKQKTRDFLNLSNEQIKKAKALEKEEERLADLKIQEYMRLKAEREEKLEREKEAEKKKKELEYARQRALQEAASDLQSMQDEMNAVRRQEEYEREWRRKEKEAVKKKQKMEEDCRLAREQQVRDNRRFQAMEIAREKREYERNIRVQIELQEKERLLDLKKQHDAEIYREQILKQINQKEKERIEERQEKFQEGVALKAEEAKRKHDIKQILDKKLENIRNNKVPEVYVAQIQRQMNLV
ncbi:hypothetical protein RUM44_012878 [Polyplax serrata]|uniref:Cilia- and flagella-associated protein 45 n=1 Tax=Polyplax serrata TaxID=468196 RepID=A0ABR1BGJ5_POLSC